MCGIGSDGTPSEGEGIRSWSTGCETQTVVSDEGVNVPVEMGMWRIDEGAPKKLEPTKMPTEAELEHLLDQDPSILGERLLVIGRQLHTPYGKIIDLLAIDADGNLNVLELKRDMTPRDVVAQTLDYGSWVKDLQRTDVLQIAQDHLGEQPFAAAFEDAFGQPLPDEVNIGQRLTIVAAHLDPSSERIVRYLETFGVPINVVFFAYLADDDRRYLARSWLITPEEQSSGSSGTGGKTKAAKWSGDWYVSFGDGLGRNWDDGRKYNFVSAGGGDWFSKTLRRLPTGARIFVNIPQAGYVAVGQTTGEATPFADAMVDVGGSRVRLADQQLNPGYEHEPRAGVDTAEYVVPVQWTVAVPKQDAYWEKGMFANQNSACKLRQEFTLEKLRAHFGIDA